jgi:16S rRNA G966 N2-methylase RsmD
MGGNGMPKSKINITMDQDLVEYIKSYAEEQRTSVSEIFTQFILNLKRAKINDPTDIILADPDFRDSLIETIMKLRSGQVKWHKYEEVF